MAGRFEPTVEDIEYVVSLTMLPRQECIQRLKGNNNNPEQAVNEYFEDPEGSTKKYRWDETQFRNDSQGTANNHGISFDIHAPDEPGPYGSHFDGVGAPSRPPSRASNNKSPMGKIIDLTAEHAAADPSMSMGYDADAELQQAIAASRLDAGMSPQETGVTGTDQPFFGPATRTQAEYQKGSWEMVAFDKSTAQDTLADPEPAQRVREADAPAFLKPDRDSHLAGLITIYHEIPITRNLFLNTQDSDINFGYDPKWWTGEPVPMVEGLSPEDQALQCTVDRELQRLMAFLDNTERSYGSVRALANHSDVQELLKKKPPTLEAAVFAAWRRKFEPHKTAMIRQIFSTGVDSEKKETVQDFAILELEWPFENSMLETFYDMADEILWPNLGSTEVEDSPYLSRIAEVIAFQVEGGTGRVPVDIPLEWYPDRYLKPAREIALEMRLRKRQVRDELEHIDRVESKLTHAPLRTGKIVTVQDLIKAALKHDECMTNGEEGSEEDDQMVNNQHTTAAAMRLSGDLTKFLESIDKKLSALNVEKEKARETFRELSKLYTEPSDEPDTPKLHKYTLRGVSTAKSMYVCRRAEPDLIDMTDGDGSSGPQDQWWRINYATTGDHPVTVEKTTAELVLEAAKTEGQKTMLVYASEKAMNHPIHALPKKLETFVKWENSNFKSEFRTTSMSENPTTDHTIIDDSMTQPVGLSSPGKRKFHESSLYNQGPDQAQGVVISEREVKNGSPDMSRDEVIVGVDPSLLSKDQRRGSVQEMKEVTSMPMLGRPLSKGEAKESTIDIMDLDQVVEDADVKEESPAVKRVGFVE